MQFLGGKARLGRAIAHILEGLRPAGAPFVEPFCGTANVTAHMTNPRYCSDADTNLIALLQAVQRGWVPPDFVPEWYYEHARAGGLDPAMRAFVLFGSSFSGKWKGGYARSDKQPNYALSAQRSLLKKASKLEGAYFGASDYRWLRPEGALVYCDPPYTSTTGYSAVARFEPDLFWETMRRWSHKNVVVISEYTAPVDFECIAAWPRTMNLQTSGDRQRVERLFRWKGLRRKPLISRRPLLCTPVPQHP